VKEWGQRSRWGIPLFIAVMVVMVLVGVIVNAHHL